jgi:hypothetical protein
MSEDEFGLSQRKSRPGKGKRKGKLYDDAQSSGESAKQKSRPGKGKRKANLSDDAQSNSDSSSSTDYRPSKKKEGEKKKQQPV